MSETEVRTREGMPFGGMPHDTLLKKLEETYISDDEDNYNYNGSGSKTNDYIRSEIIDWNSDMPFLESDHTRRDPALSRSTLNLKYNGTRGNRPELPRHPELFIGFTGDDPRGVSNDPRLDQIRSHMYGDSARANNLIVRMGNNDDYHIAERPWSNQSLSYARKEVQRQVANNTKIFTKSKEGRPWSQNMVVDEMNFGKKRGELIIDGFESKKLDASDSKNFDGGMGVNYTTDLSKILSIVQPDNSMQNLEIQNYGLNKPVGFRQVKTTDNINNKTSVDETSLKNQNDNIIKKGNEKLSKLMKLALEQKLEPIQIGTHLISQNKKLKYFNDKNNLNKHINIEKFNIIPLENNHNKQGQQIIKHKSNINNINQSHSSNIINDKNINLILSQLPSKNNNSDILKNINQSHSTNIINDKNINLILSQLPSKNNNSTILKNINQSTQLNESIITQNKSGEVILGDTIGASHKTIQHIVPNPIANLEIQSYKSVKPSTDNAKVALATEIAIALINGNDSLTNLYKSIEQSKDMSKISLATDMTRLINTQDLENKITRILNQNNRNGETNYSKISHITTNSQETNNKKAITPAKNNTETTMKQLVNLLVSSVDEKHNKLGKSKSNDKEANRVINGDKFGSEQILTNDPNKMAEQKRRSITSEPTPIYDGKTIHYSEQHSNLSLNTNTKKIKANSLNNNMEADMKEFNPNQI